MKLIRKLAPLYMLVIGAFLAVTAAGNRFVTAMVENAPISRQHVYVIDAGHGGVDGGATSCTGVLESQLNLEIALRLDDLMHFLGYETVMIRTTDRSVFTQGETIAAKKISDLKERVRIVNGSDNHVLVSIHQNQFVDEKYSGAQVFYGENEQGRGLAEQLQSAFKKTLNPDSHRNIKKADGVYLMKHAKCPAVLIECGFLSNREEEANLRSAEYQKKLCAVIASTLCSFFGAS